MDFYSLFFRSKLSDYEMNEISILNNLEKNKKIVKNAKKTKLKQSEFCS